MGCEGGSLTRGGWAAERGARFGGADWPLSLIAAFTLAFSSFDRHDDSHSAFLPRELCHHGVAGHAAEPWTVRRHNLMRVLAAIALVALFAIVAFFFYPALRSPDEALQDFIGGRDRAEDQLADPLIVTGCRSAEIVVQHLSEESMPHRRYAIGYLGNRRCSVAVPVLEGIARNKNEEVYFRADALEAISQIDQEKGRALARSYAGRRDYLGQRSQAVLAGQRIGMTRTYWQAVRRVHE